ELWHVEAFELDFRAHPHRSDRVDDLEHEEGCAERPGDAQRRADELADELARVAVEQSRHALPGGAEIARRADSGPAGAVGPVGEAPEADAPEPAAVAMHRDRATRVIDLEDALVEQHPHADDDTGDDADQYRGIGADERARSGDRDETGQHSIACHR